MKEYFSNLGVVKKGDLEYEIAPGLETALSGMTADEVQQFVIKFALKGIKRWAAETISAEGKGADAISATAALEYQPGTRVGTARLSATDKMARTIVTDLLGSIEGRKMASALVGRSVPANRKSDEFKAFVAELIANEKVQAKAEKLAKAMTF